jgi:hypothetical protein
MRSTVDGHPCVNIESPLGRLVHNLSKIFPYPYQTEAGNDYKKSIKCNVYRFIKAIQEIEGEDDFISYLKENLPEFERIGSSLIQVIDTYLSGDSSNAYTILDSTISSDFMQQYWRKLRLKIDSNCYMFRARECIGTIDKHEEIFHIPFNQRHLVKNQRYSIAGVPCLYLGSSTFVCWLEMGKPDLNKLHFSCFLPVNNNRITVLDLTTSFALFLQNNSENLEGVELREYIEAAIATWVITQACSFKRRFKNANFNVEYIIPNLLLQWVKNNKDQVDGIRYPSTHYDFRPEPNLGYNYVFPPQNSNGKFCSHLSGLFKFTKPTSWQILQALSSVAFLKAPIPTDICSTFEDQLLTEYVNTSFGHIEQFILKNQEKMKPIN